jgi:single-stranded DNA-binding protein
MSMYLIGTIVLGQDARTFASSDQTKIYASVSGWWKHGRGESARFQWCDLKILSQGAERAAEMLKKGKTVQVVVSNPHVELYEPKDKSKAVSGKIVGIIDRFDFVGKKDDAPTPAPARRDFSEQERDDTDIPF